MRHGDAPGFSDRIGSGVAQCFQHRSDQKTLRFVVVDAGIGVPSEAAAALEMGADAVLVNSAIALPVTRL